MAQPRTIQIHVEVDMTEARRRVKRAMADLAFANRELARLEERIQDLQTRVLESYGIEVRKENVSSE